MLSQDSINFVVNNLKSKIEKLNLSGLEITDEHIEALVKKCKRIKVLSLDWTVITNDSLRYISQHLKHILTKLSINFCVDIRYTKLFDIKPVELLSMEKLKVLNCEKITNARLEYRRKQASQYIDEKKEGNFDPENLSPINGIWEIKVKQIGLFHSP